MQLFKKTMQKTIGKTQLVAETATATGLPKKTIAQVLDALPVPIQEHLYAGERVRLPELGTFEPHTRPARTGRNPATGEPIDIAEKRVPRFNPAGALKERLAA